MKLDETRYHLSQAELACLRQLARHEEVSGRRCSRSVIEALQGKGLVTALPPTPPPLAPSSRYRLTALGLSLLESRKRGDQT